MKWKMFVPGICLAVAAMLMTPSTSSAWKLTVANDCDNKVRVIVFMYNRFQYKEGHYVTLEPHTAQELTTGTECFWRATGDWRNPKAESKDSLVDMGVGYDNGWPRCWNFVVRVKNSPPGCTWERY